MQFVVYSFVCFISFESKVQAKTLKSAKIVMKIFIKTTAVMSISPIFCIMTTINLFLKLKISNVSFLSSFWSR